jgi:hypothetical protein
MSLGGAPLQVQLTQKGGPTTSVWTAWFSALFGIVKPIGTNGTTAQRPIVTPNNQLYIGQGYFDTTLGYMVWIKSLNPTVWVNGAGAVV